MRSASASPTHLLGAAFAVHLGGVDDAVADLERAAHRRDLARPARRGLAHAPGAQAERRQAARWPGNVQAHERIRAIECKIGRDHRYDDDVRRRPRRSAPNAAGASRAPAPLADGEVRLRIDRFALTSNNITYAAFGDAMNYWEFFPTGDADDRLHPGVGLRRPWPSRAADGVDVGERFYGYWPMADDVVLQPGARHRRAASPTAPRTGASCTAVYNQYLRCSSRPGLSAPSTRPSRRCCGRCSSPRS